MLWKDLEKPERIKRMCKLLLEERVETEQGFQTWLSDYNNVTRLMKLKGVGQKTADYFKILVGIQTSALDRHLLRFIDEAGVEAADYDEAQRVINLAADYLGIERALFDQSIWKYMSSRKNKVRCTMQHNTVAPKGLGLSLRAIGNKGADAMSNSWRKFAASLHDPLMTAMKPYQGETLETSRINRIAAQFPAFQGKEQFVQPA